MKLILDEKTNALPDFPKKSLIFVGQHSGSAVKNAA
jgi:hypothetical protein